MKLVLTFALLSLFLGVSSSSQNLPSQPEPLAAPAHHGVRTVYAVPFGANLTHGYWDIPLGAMVQLQFMPCDTIATCKVWHRRESGKNVFARIILNGATTVWQGYPPNNFSPPLTITLTPLVSGINYLDFVNVNSNGTYQVYQVAIW